jgi:hypothetical protein
MLYRAFRTLLWLPVRLDVFGRTEGSNRCREGMGDSLGGSGGRGDDMITEAVRRFRWLTEGLTFGFFAGAEGFPRSTGKFGFSTGGGGLGAPFGEL